jgi:hypothetical protein
VKISYAQTYQEPLAEFGAELVEMIRGEAFELIANRFGYALAFERPKADAIATDIDLCLSSEGRFATLSKGNDARISVKYFRQPNGANLFGVVECFLPLNQDSGELLAELIVTTKDDDYYVTLESVSYAA